MKRLLFLIPLLVLASPVSAQVSGRASTAAPTPPPSTVTAPAHAESAVNQAERPVTPPPPAPNAVDTYVGPPVNPAPESVQPARLTQEQGRRLAEIGGRMDAAVRGAFQRNPQLQHTLEQDLTQIAAIREPRERMQALDRFRERYRDPYLATLEFDLFERFAEEIRGVYGPQYEVTTADNISFMVRAAARLSGGDPPPVELAPATTTLGARDYQDSHTIECYVTSGAGYDVTLDHVRAWSKAGIAGACRADGVKQATLNGPSTQVVQARGDLHIHGSAIALGGNAFCTAGAIISLGAQEHGIVETIFAPVFWGAQLDKEEANVQLAEQGANLTPSYSGLAYAFGAGGAGADCQGEVNNISTTVTR